MGGGSALGFQADRLDLDEYLTVSTFIGSILTKYYKHVILPRQPPGKKLFVDVDILVSEQKQTLDIHTVFGSTICVHNGSIISFEQVNQDGRRFQIDLLKFEQKQLPFARFCYGDGDLSILLGMSLCRVNLKWGHKGLCLMNNHEQLMLTKNDLQLALSFLGMSYQDWQQGFHDENSLFEFVTTNRFFRPFTHKIRFNNGEQHVIETHPMIIRFFDWLKNNEQRFSKEPVDLVVIREEAIKHFNKQKELEVQKQLDLALYERYNGRIVMEITGLKGNRLDEFMKFCKLHLPNEESLIKMSTEQVSDEIDRMFMKYVFIKSCESKMTDEELSQMSIHEVQDRVYRMCKQQEDILVNE